MSMMTRIFLVVILFFSATVVLAAPAETTLSDLLNEQLMGSVGLSGTGIVTQRAFIFAIGVANPSVVDPELRSAINRRRTDIQLGATSNSPHATSVLEKPGIADLLSFALDRGAIKQTMTGTGVTLSTTPYAIWTRFGALDTQDTWDKAEVARNLSFSATFSSDNVTSGDFSSFTSGEAKYVLLGSRSPRDKKFLDSVRLELGKTFLDADHEMDQSCKDLFKGNLNSPIFVKWQDMNKWLSPRHQGETVGTARQHLTDLVQELMVNQSELKSCLAAVLAGEQSIQGGLDAVTEATKKYLADHRPELSVAALFVRDATLSDYYAAKLLYGYDRDPFTINLNAEADWNKESTTAAGMPLRSLRAYSVELGFNSKTLAKGRLDCSLSSKASLDKALDSKSIVIGEAKLNLHLNDTLRLPLSLTYANRETQTIRPGWQFNVGISALLDEVLRRK